MKYLANRLLHAISIKVNSRKNKYKLLVIDDNCNFIYGNVILDYGIDVTKDEILNKNLFDNFPKLKEKRFKKRLDSVLNDGPPMIFSADLSPDFFTTKTGDGTAKAYHTTFIASFQLYCTKPNFA